MIGDPFTMVVAIVLITGIASVFKAKYRAQNGIIEDEDGNQSPVKIARDDALIAEVKSLRERVQVLERIVTDEQSTVELNRELERLKSL
ncbi:hypothetical protein LPB140_07520 [Sphingorhabdus lutea]|uniref:Phage shock protein B n=1 Tax=Sphingorhabdus lutea TaxID=1913578 RepID=A0A1L3JC09_9SPHN|nr:hypothetical protein [Sphingorhabdus lutea]APG62661.1 hypothetical protein LPB140_07520 [Sphingorhabdus lutea]